jgi:hypothetical protein
MNWVVPFNRLLAELLIWLAGTLGFVGVVVEAWGTYVGPHELVNPAGAIALTSLFSAIFIRRLVG